MPHLGAQLFLVTMLLALPATVRAQQDAAPVEKLIGQLNDESYATRISAACALRKAGLDEWQNACGQNDDATRQEAVFLALQDALKHKSLEVRMAAARILREISVAVHEAELQRLLNPHCEASTIHLDHWLAFSTWVGDDLPARTTFAAISRRLANSPYPRHASTQASFRHRGLNERLDPFRLDPEDTVAWMMLLAMDLEEHESMPHLTPRISVAMSHVPMGPAASTSVEGEVLGRLIDRWIADSNHFCGDREKLLIAMRYQRRQTARVMCQRVLETDETPPAAAVTGLLVASALELTELEVLATRRLNDDRVAHVWQLIPSRKTKIRTEVRDVALALLLHHHGVDPRSIGFAELQADPLLRFRDHSLGFPDEASRMESHRLAAPLLASSPIRRASEEVEHWILPNPAQDP